MSIYIDINGSWGPADELVLIDDSTWEHDDYERVSMWSIDTLMRYAEGHDRMTPTEWDDE